MGETKKVSYLVIGAYATFVVGSSLLVGLLPPFVNRPTCKDAATNPPSGSLFRNSDQVVEHVEPVLERGKRNIDAVVKPDLNERVRNFQAKYPGIFNGRQNRNLRADYKICQELISPTPGVEHPWYSPRLPDNVIPSNYDIEIYAPQWGLKVYDGFSNITFDVTSSTKTILLHAAFEIPQLQYITDKNGNKIEVECLGEFQYFKNDYFVIQTTNYLQPTDGPFVLSFIFIAFLPDYDSGIFEFQFKNVDGTTSTMLASKFEPIQARNAYPCFDEPRFKATYNIQIDHPIGTVAVSNTPLDSDTSFEEFNQSLTRFVKTPPMPTYLMAYVVFNKADFGVVSGKAQNGIPINVWGRKGLVEQGFANDTLEMAIKVYDGLLDIFRNVDSSALPPAINILAIPEYPIDAIPHFGLPIFREDLILFKNESASERNLQKTALLMAKQFSEFWFGNFATFAWWDELWLQEGLGDYIKYRAVEEAYPEWNILEQFITEELIYALTDDAYPSSHPIYKYITNPWEIEEYFDVVESSKTAAILRMVEEELTIADMYNAITDYLNAHKWGVADINVFYKNIGKVDKWDAKEFFDRWTRQANYPLLTVRLESENGQQFLTVNQKRNINSNSSIFSGDLLYPSEYGFIWYVPLKCAFGTGPTNADDYHLQDFYIDQKDSRNLVRNTFGKDYTWVHCDNKFTGYYATDYTSENWEILGDAMKSLNNEFTAEDRANIIHNLFVNAFTERTTYFTLVDVLSYLPREKDYLPWRTTYKHLTDIADILQYKRSFLEVSEFFSTMMRQIEADIDLWSPIGVHVEELLKETIIDLACYLQDSYCLKKATELWEGVVPQLLSQNYNLTVLPPYVREVVFNYHLQNTYEVGDFELILLEYENFNDLFERRRLLEALSYPRLPWLLTRILEVERETGLDKVDFFDTMKLLSENPLGREIAWDYMRINFARILNEYGLDDPRIGQMLIDVVHSFENEYIFSELIEFVFFTETGSTANARFRALEIGSTNFVWLVDKEAEIIKAFGGGREGFSHRNIKTEYLDERMHVESFKVNARETLKKKLAEKKMGGLFEKLSNILL